MKVLIIHTLYRYKGGEDMVVENEKNLLIQNDIQTDVLYFRNNGYKITIAAKYLMQIFNPFSFIRTIIKLNQFQPDVIHIHNLHFGASPSVLWAARIRKIPVISTLHNYRLICPSGTLFFKGEIYKLSLNQKFPWKAVIQKVYKNSYALTFWLAFSIWINKFIGTYNIVSRYLTFTEFSKQLFSDGGVISSDKVVVKANFGNAVNKAVQNRLIDYIYVGRLSQEKGIELLLQTFVNSEKKVTIVGDGPLKCAIETAAELNSNIRYLDFCDKATVYNKIRQSAVLIFPSVCYEGMPLTIIEALSCGTPVIATNHGAMQCMIKDGYNGFLFKPGDHLSLINALNRWEALSDVAKDRMRKNALTTYAKVYTPEQNFSQLFSIYQSVINEHKRIA